MPNGDSGGPGSDYSGALGGDGSMGRYYGGSVATIPGEVSPGQVKDGGKDHIGKWFGHLTLFSP
jgi:hypothetical protein